MTRIGIVESVYDSPKSAVVRVEAGGARRRFVVECDALPLVGHRLRLDVSADDASATAVENLGFAPTPPPSPPPPKKLTRREYTTGLTRMINAFVGRR